VKPYELLYIISPDKDEETIAALIAKVNGTIEALGGKVEGVFQTEPWGRRRLAYPINHQEEGYYVLTHFAVESKPLDELERTFKLTEGIWRYMITHRIEE
jgi:small subunit ribosomal protein S6